MINIRSLFDSLFDSITIEKKDTKTDWEKEAENIINIMYNEFNCYPYYDKYVAYIKNDIRYIDYNLENGDEISIKLLDGCVFEIILKKYKTYTGVKITSDNKNIYYLLIDVIRKITNNSRERKIQIKSEPIPISVVFSNPKLDKLKSLILIRERQLKNVKDLDERKCLINELNNYKRMVEKLSQ